MEVIDGSVAIDATPERVQDRLAIVAMFAARLYGKRAQAFRQQMRQAARQAGTTCSR